MSKYGRQTELAKILMLLTHAILTATLLSSTNSSKQQLCAVICSSSMSMSNVQIDVFLSSPRLAFSLLVHS